MVKVFYRASVRCPVTARRVAKIVRAAAREERKIRGEISVQVIGEAAMRKLNRRWRGFDRPTDVLSFAWGEEQRLPATGILGEIYLSYPYIVRQAKRFGAPVREEFTRMLAHGLLHLAGYEHVRSGPARKMFGLQEKIVGKCS